MPVAWGNATTTTIRTNNSIGITVDKPSSLTNGDEGVI